LGHSSDVEATAFAKKDGWLFNYSLMSPLSPGIFQDVRPKVADAPLPFIFKT
jgi:hypothetical protein